MAPVPEVPAKEYKACASLKVTNVPIGDRSVRDPLIRAQPGFRRTLSPVRHVYGVSRMVGH
jgi:hypothetical protein